MPQTNRTVNDIIVQAFLLIGELAPDALPTDTQVKNALYYLNDMFDNFSTLGVYIPFINQLQFTMTAGKDIYSISNVITNPDVTGERIVELDFVNLIRNNLSYYCRPIKRAELFYNSRLTNLQSRPGYVVLERRNLQSNLQFYPIPDFPYEVVVRGKFMLDHLELFDQLDEIPPHYFRFLRYALGRELVAVYPSANWTERLEKDYDEMFKNIKAAPDINMTIKQDGLLVRNYGDLIFESFGIFT